MGERILKSRKLESRNDPNKSMSVQSYIQAFQCCLHFISAFSLAGRQMFCRISFCFHNFCFLLFIRPSFKPPHPILDGLFPRLGQPPVVRIAVGNPGVRLECDAVLGKAPAL